VSVDVRLPLATSNSFRNVVIFNATFGPFGLCLGEEQAADTFKGWRGSDCFQGNDPYAAQSSGEPPQTFGPNAVVSFLEVEGGLAHDGKRRRLAPDGHCKP
jgi:hypothetical protein